MAHVLILNSHCTGCRMCEFACSAFHEDAYRPSAARIFMEVNPTTADMKGQTCLQMGCAKCQEVCPHDAISAQHITLKPKGRFRGREKLDLANDVSVLMVDEDLCTNCGECYAVCPTGVIRPHPDRGKAVKCDLCGGVPQCIAFCQNPYVLAVDLRLDKVDREGPRS